MQQGLTLGFSPAQARLSVRWSSQQVENDRLKDTYVLRNLSSRVVIVKLREHCSHKSNFKKKNELKQKKKTEQAFITFSSLKKKTEEIKKYKSIYHSHFEGQTDWFSNAYLPFG